MSTNHTPNYSLSQWERSDKVQMDDFNADNARIDAALAAKADKSALNSLSSTVSGHAAALAGKGNCRIVCHTYIGKGGSGGNSPTVIRFSGQPLFAVISNGQAMVLAAYGVRTLYYGLSNGTALVASWSGNTLSFYGNDPYVQMNVKGSGYSVLSFFAADS